MKDEIIIKYLLGESTIEQAAEVDRWLMENSDNQKYFLNLQKIWEQSRQLELNQEHSYDTDAEWQRLKLKMSKADKNSSLLSNMVADKMRPDDLKNYSKPKIVHLRAWKWVAAAVVVLIGAWFALSRILTTDNDKKDLILTASATPVSDTLSDGSIITLNHYSSLQRPLEFNGKTREVTLQAGEAFFNVVHMAEKPFLVHIGSVEIKVLGTSFNIKKNGNQTVIDVATGKVLVQYKQKKLVLNAQEKLSIDPSTIELNSQKSESLLYNYYVSQKFIANNTRLEDLVKVLNEAYNQNIVFGRPELKDFRITSAFKKEPIDNILKIISETFAIQVLYKKDSIVLQ